jgi:hypothetical protein
MPRLKAGSVDLPKDHPPLNGPDPASDPAASDISVDETYTDTTDRAILEASAFAQQCRGDLRDSLALRRSVQANAEAQKQPKAEAQGYPKTSALVLAG